MLPDRVSNPGSLTYESGALPIALRGPSPYYEPRENFNCIDYIGKYERWAETSP